MTVSIDVVDAARLVAWGARPKERPARHEVYERLVRRYHDDDGFAETCELVATGLGLELVIDRDVGTIAIAESDSPLRMPFSDFMRRVNETKRALAGLVVLAVAKIAYPHPAQLDDPQRVPRVTAAAVVEYLNRLVERIGDDEGDPDAAQGDSELWRAWAALRQARSHATRSSAADRAGLVKKVCTFLEGEGHLSPLPGDDKTWRATPRFRIAVRSMVEDSTVFGALVELETGNIDTSPARPDRPTDEPPVTGEFEGGDS
jgi:hypothetical protein